MIQKSLTFIWQNRIGLALVGAISLASWALGQAYPRIGNVTIALVLGLIIGNILPASRVPYHAAATWAEKRVLAVSIVLLGVELQLNLLANLGPLAVVVIVASMGTALMVSVWLGRALGYSRDFAYLIAAGNGVCGSSAIAATSLALKSKEQDTALSIGVVNLLGTLGIVLIPVLVALLGLSETQSGLLIGGSLQAVGQVVAAGYAVGSTVGSLALIVKMGRVLLLGPMVVLIHNLSQFPTPNPKMMIHVPWFVVGFLVSSVVASAKLLPADVLQAVSVAGKFLLVIAMVGIGLRLQLRVIFRSGFKAFAYGALVSSAQVLVVIVLVSLLGMGV